MRLHAHGPRLRVSLHSLGGRRLLISGLLLVGAIVLVGPDIAVRTVTAADVAGQATVRRDEYGVAHITAPTEEAAAFAHGYVAAEDQIETLAPLFLRAQGKLASVFGEARAAEDMQMLLLGIPQNAGQQLASLPEPMQKILDGYAAGYNAFLKVAGSRAPAWAAPITGADVLAHCRAVYLLGFAPPPNSLMGRIPSAPSTASNFWALGKEKSTSGNAILLANPHLAWFGPFVFHEVHLHVPGTINVAGATLVGFPVVTIGFNERLGWTHTANLKSGAEQLYRVTIDPADPKKYLHDSGARPFTVSTTSLQVKTATSVETRVVENWSTHLGPVLKRDAKHAWVFNSPNLAAVNFLTQYNRMAKARSFQEFKAALEMQQLPILSVGYADRDGNIFYIENGRYPVRPTPPAGQPWLDGDRSENAPTGVMPVSALPQMLNPKGGYVQNANNGFAYSTRRQTVDMSVFPPQLRNERELSMRAQTNLAKLEARERFTLDEVIRGALDSQLPLAGRIKAELVALVKNSTDATSDVRRAAEQLAAWDDRITSDSVAAPLFVSWWDEYQAAAKASGKVFTRAWDAADPLQTPTGIGAPEVALRSLAKVVVDYQTAFGSTAVPWGKVYRIRRGTLEFPAPGASESFGLLNSLDFRKDDAVRRSVNWGTSYMLSVEFAGAPIAYSVLPNSQSSYPESPQFADQTALFSRAAAKRFWMSESDVERHTVRRYAPGK